MDAWGPDPGDGGSRPAWPGKTAAGTPAGCYDTGRRRINRKPYQELPMTRPGRIKPPMGHDNAWWWEQAAKGVLAIQRCSRCQALRHPPRPMCGECRSMEWDVLAASGKGTVASYTVLYHPQFPGFEYPLIIVLVDLEEGTRITAELKDCDPEAVDFGMAVTAYIHEDEDGFRIPMFRPATRGGN
jgi:uncharacterized OB-fold protein